MTKLTRTGWLAVLATALLGCQGGEAVPVEVAPVAAESVAAAASAESEAKPCCHGKDAAVGDAAAVAPAPAAAEEAEAEVVPPCHAAAAEEEPAAETVVPEPSGTSIYLLDAELTDQTGAKVGLDLFRGHPTAVVMFYGTCQSACPILVRDLERFEEALAPEVRSKMRILLVTLDPARDTTEKLAEYARQYEMPTDRWRLVHTDEETTRALALLLNVKYRFVEGGHISHSNLISLLDPQGTLVFQHEGLAQPVEILAQKATELAR